MSSDKQKEYRETLAIADMCRSYLYMNDFLSESENEKVFNRISKWQDKKKVSISREQLESVEIIYKGK